MNLNECRNVIGTYRCRSAALIDKKGNAGTIALSDLDSRAKSDRESGSRCSNHGHRAAKTEVRTIGCYSGTTKFSPLKRIVSNGDQNQLGRDESGEKSEAKDGGVRTQNAQSDLTPTKAFRSHNMDTTEIDDHLLKVQTYELLTYPLRPRNRNDLMPSDAAQRFVICERRARRLPFNFRVASEPRLGGGGKPSHPG